MLRSLTLQHKLTRRSSFSGPT